MNKPKTIERIVAAYLRDHGYDGLTDRLGCDCRLCNLMPCGQPWPNCVPGYAGPDPGGGRDPLIYVTKSAARAAGRAAKDMRRVLGSVK